MNFLRYLTAHFGKLWRKDQRQQSITSLFLTEKMKIDQNDATLDSLYMQIEGEL